MSPDDAALDDFYAELRRHHLEALWRINTKIMPFEPRPRPRAWLWRYEDLARLAELAGKLVPIDVKVGNTVVYSKYGGTEITIDGEDLLILTSRDVLAVSEGKSKKK